MENLNLKVRGAEWWIFQLDAHDDAAFTPKAIWRAGRIATTPPILTVRARIGDLRAHAG